MSGNGAFNDEMAFRDTNFENDPMLASFALAVRAELRATPDEALTRNVVPELAAAAAQGSRAAARSAPASPVSVVTLHPRRPRFAMAARIAFAVALLPALFAGMAVAGVSLPSPAQDAFKAVGIELPNQDDSGPASNDGSPSDARELKEENGEGAGQDKSNPARIHGRGNGEQGRGRALGKRGLAPGQTKPKGGNGNAGGNKPSTPPGQANKPSTPPGQANKPSSPGSQKPAVPPGQVNKPDQSSSGAGNGQGAVDNALGAVTGSVGS